MHPQLGLSLQNILKNGTQVTGTNYKGYTLSQLTKIGVLKTHLKKALRAGYIKEMHVRNQGTGPINTFFCVEVASDDSLKKVQEAFTPPAAQPTQQEMDEALKTANAVLGIETKVD